jgi:hypothetical protein
VAVLEARTAGLENGDFCFLQASVRRLLNEVRDARDALRQVEVRMDKLHGSTASISEIKRLRDAVSDGDVRERLLDIRMSTIESRLGLNNPMQPVT